VAEFTVPRLEKLDIQPEVQKLLNGLLANRGVQTFLWSGPEGTGKKTYALALARSLFCKEGPDCSGCANCKQVLNKTHADLFWVDRDHSWADDPEEKKKNELTVKVALNLSGKLHRAPFSAPCKVAVIPNADQMNEQAQNALLKTLEEPPANTLIILLAEKTGDFLPTVLSRCRLVRFPALPPSTLENLLVQNYGWAKADAVKAALEANGNMTLALKLGDKSWAEFRDKVCADWDRALQGPDEEWLALVAEYDQWEPDFLEEREVTATQRKAEVLTAAFQVYLALWSRRLSGEVEIPAKLSSLTVGAILKCLQKHQDMIPMYLNSKMILDHLFLELREGLKKGTLLGQSFMELSVQI
jgi:DNA polymerase III subunit delta'